ncbi:MAG: hypothetical protein CMJ88_13640 [Planctomycetes bacterium]|nr:hypothetical protein [Planctomycetota bacterium]
MRLRPSGSAGGHNGLKSVQQLLGTDAYPRLRLGIGPPASDDPDGGSEGRSKAAVLRGRDWPDFVLAPFLPEEKEVLGRVLVRAADCTQGWLDGEDLQSLMGTFNS